MENRAASLRDCLWEQHSKHIKALMLIIISILCAALICLTGCVSSSSDEDTSSESSNSESKTEKYSNHEAGFTVSLPRYWTELVGEDASIENSVRMEFTYDYDFICCTPWRGYEDVSFSDLSKEDIAEHYSVSVKDVSKKKLSSGSYYLAKYTYDDDSVERHAISYVTIKNDHFIDFMYVSLNDENRKLSDFEEMVDSVKYE